MEKILLRMASFLLVLFVALGKMETVYASEGEEKITITINASDDNGGLLYAIDSDEPEAFTSNNIFEIPEGTSHVIYVKDAAGNITSQTYTHQIRESETGEDESINIELDIGNTDSASNNKTKDYSNYEYLTDTKIDNSDANVISKITTDGSDQAEKVFYTITTQEGAEFYLVIEQGASNKVHLLNTVTIDDLAALAEGGTTKTSAEAQEDTLLEALKGSEEKNEITKENIEDSSKDSDSRRSNKLYIYILIAAAAGAYYYFKIYKNKKNDSMDAMDAMDMDDFVMEEEDSDDEELEFSEKEKQELLDELISGKEAEDEELNEMDPELYAEDIYEELEPGNIYNVGNAGEESHATSHETEIVNVEEVFYLSEDNNEEYDEELDGEEQI